MPVPDYDIFDFHQHMGSTADSGGVIIPGAVAGAGIDSLELESRLHFMDSGGIRQAIAIPGHNYNRAAGIAATRAENDAIAAYRDRQPARFPVAAGVIEPLDQSESLAEVDRIDNELGLIAVSFHTEYQAVTLDSPWMIRLLERMAERGLVPLLHAANIIPHEALWRLAKVARAMPALTIIALEPFFTYEGMQEARFVADIAPNIVFDLSACVDSDMAIEFARTFGADRLVYGSQYYSQVATGRRMRAHDRRALAMIDDIARSDDLAAPEKVLILGGNARRVLKAAAPTLRLDNASN